MSLSCDFISSHEECSVKYACWDCKITKNLFRAIGRSLIKDLIYDMLQVSGLQRYLERNFFTYAFPGFCLLIRNACLKDCVLLDASTPAVVLHEHFCSLICSFSEWFYWNWILVIKRIEIISVFYKNTHNKRKALITCLHKTILTRSIIVLSLFDETQRLVVEFDFGRFRFTADSVPTLLFHKRTEGFFRILALKCTQSAMKVFLKNTRGNTCLFMLKGILIKIQYL